MVWVVVGAVGVLLCAAILAAPQAPGRRGISRLEMNSDTAVPEDQDKKHPPIS